MLLALAGATLPAVARTYCCTDDGGRRVCGDVVLPQCLKRPYQEFNAQGVVARQHEGPLTAEQRAQRDAELARKKEEERRAADEERLNRALLASYSSARDIDAKRDRMLAEANTGLKLLQERYDVALARKQKFLAEAELFQKRPMPEALKLNMRDNQAELASLQATLDDRRREIAAIQTRFDDEKRRYLRVSQPASSATGR
ncbi:MAG TPA: hypothetical protein VFF82_08300 [Rhodocyclaceae bacterium]|nr:hypothetical protein [Rhodocyclaceae bacterium]